MRRSHRLQTLVAGLLVAGLLVAITPSAHAEFGRMSYQGVLTDAMGNLVPDGSYDLTFRIYDDPVAGDVLWTESHVDVPVTKGGFSLVLGSITRINVPFRPIPTSYLGVQVGADPELLPRIELSAAPAAMSVAMLGDNGQQAGELSWQPTGTGSGGGFLRLYGLNPIANNAIFEPDFQGSALYAYLDGAAGSGVTWDGNVAGNPGTFTIAGTSSTVFNTRLTGSNSVALPGNAVSASEILDETGITSVHQSGQIVISPVGALSTEDLLSVTITTPAPGYIVLEGDFQAGLYPVNSRYIFYQITETSAAARDESHYFNAGLQSAAFGGWMPCAVSRVFYKDTAGEYTFYLQASNAVGSGAIAFNPTLRASYVSTSYGTVITAVTAQEAARFSSARPVPASTDPMQSGGGGSTVDLRELEMRVLREEARLAEAREALLRAQLGEQEKSR